MLHILVDKYIWIINVYITIKCQGIFPSALHMYSHLILKKHCLGDFINIIILQMIELMHREVK